ncbi:MULTISPECIES: hypothetical protein [unclassified Moraxella]|uniref:hypothetical protein n=1 Tax=unclassified Moraxella TaxID=2685852 RepID=UPI002B4168B5|nr:MULTISPECIES: hypothetical protein [unclassified Moraxella]
MDIFQNDHEVLTIGNLTIENNLGSVVIHGDVEIGVDEVGVLHAKALYDFAKNLVQTLEQPSNLLKNKPSPNHIDTMDNPFA